MKNLLCVFILLFSVSSFAKSTNPLLLNKIKYKTYFGKCPSKVGGKLTLLLMKEFEKNNSLKDVKELIIDKALEEKFFLSDYQISFDPLKKVLKFRLECPEAMMKVQIYKANGDELYTAVLVENGKLFDPTYEVLLRSEKKIKGKLPHLALPVASLDSKVHLSVTELILSLEPQFRKKISEVIVNENNELTVILSVNNRPSSAFLGTDYWTEKVGKLVKVIDYLKKKKSVPAVINLTNSKKIVVKFSDTI